MKELFPLELDDRGIFKNGIIGPMIFEDEKILDFILSSIPEEGRFLEIGTWTASTVCYLADRRKDVIFDTLDIWFMGKHDWKKVLCAVLNVSFRNNVRLHWVSSQEFGNLLRDNIYDVILVDGDHTSPGIDDDLNLSARLLKDGGKIFVHDYVHEQWGDVNKAVDKFCSETDFEITGQVESMVRLENV
jgi:hypothetical protein